MSRPTPPTRTPSYYPPFMRSFQKEMSDLMDSFRGVSPDFASDIFGNGGALMAPTDVAETETGVEVTMDVPGISEDALDISVHGDTLVIKGEKSDDREEKEKDYHLVERRYGSFRRQVPLGFVPEEGAVTAKIANGVLTLSVARPKDAPAAVQKVSISKS